MRFVSFFGAAMTAEDAFIYMKILFINGLQFFAFRC